MTPTETRGKRKRTRREVRFLSDAVGSYCDTIIITGEWAAEMQARIDANRQALAGENLTDEERKALASEADKYEAELKKTVLALFYLFFPCLKRHILPKNV